MENQFFRCTQRAITQRRVITLGPIFIKMVLNRAQGLKEKSQEVSARKNNNRQRYNKKCRRGGGFRPPPALLGLRGSKGQICQNSSIPIQRSNFKQRQTLKLLVPTC